MAKALTTLHVGIGGSFDGLSKAFSGALGAVDGFGSKITSAGSSLMKFTGIGAAVSVGLAAITAGIGAVAGGVKVASEVKQAFDSMDINAKLSDRLGVATEKLIGLQHAANLSGISSEEVTGAFEHMFKSLGKAGDDGDKSAAAINAMGLSVDTLVAMKPDDAFAAISDKIAGISNPTDRAAAAMAVFGKSGQSLLPMLKDGSAGLASAQKEAEKLGLTYSRVDAKKIEDANDAITRLKAVGTGMAQKIAVGIAPVVEGIAVRLTSLGVRLRPVFEGIISGIGSIFERAQPYIDAFDNFVAGALPGLADIANDTMGGIWAAVQTAWGNIYGFVAPIVMSVYDVIASHWQEIIDTTVGLGLSIWNAFSGALEGVFNLATSIWNGVVSVWNSATSLITGQTNDTADANTTAFENIYQVVNNFVEGFTTGLNTAAFMMQHWEDVADLTTLGVGMAVVRTGNQIAYVFTDVIPYGINFAIAAFRDYGAMQGVMLANLGANIVTFVANIPALLARQTTMDAVLKQFSPLSEGFESEVAKLKPIADRIPGELESSLGNAFDEKSKELGDGLAGYLEEQAKKAGGIGKKIGDALRNGLQNMKNPGLTKEQKSPEITPTLNPANLTLGIMPEFKAAKLLRFGSGQAQLATANLQATLATAGLGTSAAGAVASPIAPRAPANNASVAGGSQSPESQALAVLKIISQYIVKWDTNPPLAAASL